MEGGGMMKTYWKIIIPLGIMLIAAGAYGGFFLFLSGNTEQKATLGGNVPAIQSEQQQKDIPTEVIHEPASKDIISFTTGEFTDGHEFITDFHQYYNNTLCWGRVNTANYKEQKDKALEIVEVFKGIEISNEDLYNDFVQIENSAKKVIKSDNRKAMIQLHRLFHDLDIHLNGYARDDTFGVTAFKGV